MIVVNRKKLQFFASIEDLVSSDRNGVYISVAAETIALNNQPFEAICNSNEAICYADGELAVLALRKSGYSNAIKIPGVELWLAFIQKASMKSTYVIGSSDIVINKVADRLISDFGEAPKYYRNGFLSEKDIEDLENRLLIDRPELVILAMGQPRQELLADRLFKKHKAKYLCVGGSLDVYSGTISRAPNLMIKFKLEWLYRLLLEPKRIKRQLRILPVAKDILLSKGKS
jgi:UDP-N-acetyl-D-mannosaminouronate:lipid I N-acetyl-D-mannosaminouronosyltransferase